MPVVAGTLYRRKKNMFVSDNVQVLWVKIMY